MGERNEKKGAESSDQLFPANYQHFLRHFLQCRAPAGTSCRVIGFITSLIGGQRDTWKSHLSPKRGLLNTTATLSIKMLFLCHLNVRADYYPPFEQGK